MFCIIFAEVNLLFSSFNKNMRTKLLLTAGIIVPIIFWTSTIIGAFIHGNYNHFSNTVSELGAIGTKSQYLMFVATAVCGILSLLFMAGLYQACKELGISMLPIHTIISIPIMFFWVAAFPLGNSLHASTGSIIFLLYIGVIMAIFLWHGTDLLQTRLLSLASLLILLLIFLRLIPSIQNAYPGLIQRIVHFGWSVWFISLTISFTSLLNNKKATPNLITK